MSSTYTGIVLTGTPAFTSQPAQAFPDYDDIQGTLVELDSLPMGASVDNIFYYNSPNSGKYLQRVFDGPYRAAWAGIVDDGNDHATELQALASSNKVTEILFDDPRGATIILNSATITIDEHIILRFAEGNKLTGDAIINGGIIDASYSSQIADVSITLNPAGTSTGKFSVKWYGAEGKHNGSVNDSIPIQRCIDIIIASDSLTHERMLHTLFFPAGYYYCKDPLIASNWQAGNNRYEGFTMFFEGETSFWESSASGTTLDFSSGTHAKQNFGLAIQNGKGVHITGLKFTGGFAPPNDTPSYAFFSQSLAAFTDGVSRDNTYSPYAGIVIDPFAYSTPPGGASNGYPQFNGEDGAPQFYRGSSGHGGSTGTIITDVIVDHFVVGICNSPNGVVGANAELMLIEKTQFYGCKVCVSSSHDQEKTNEMRHCACWGGTHTFFATNLYGVQISGNWIIDSIQLARNVINFIHNLGGGYYPTHVSNIFAESCAHFGFMSAQQGSTVVNANFDFARPDRETSAYMDWMIDGYGVTYKSCNFRIYNNLGWPVSVHGENVFENCVFDAVPFSGSYGQYVNGEGPRFIDCMAGGATFGPSTPIYHYTSRSFWSVYGNNYVVDPAPNYPNVKIGMILNNSTAFKEIYIGHLSVNVGSLGTDRSFNLTGITNGWYDSNDVGKLVLSNHLGGSNGATTPVGIITAVTVSTTTTITVSYAAPSLTTGTWDFFCMYPLLFTASFMGEVTASSPYITNIQMDWGNLSYTVGNLLRTPCFASGVYNNWIKVISLDTSDPAHPFLTMAVNSYYTDNAVYFNNAESKFAESDSTNFGLTTFQNLPFPRGARIRQLHYTRYIEFEVTSSGFINGSPQASYRMISPYVGRAFKHITGNYTVDLDDDIIEADASGGNIVITLQEVYNGYNPGQYGAKTVTIRKVDSSGNTVTINAYSGQNIDGNSSIVLSSQYDTRNIYFAINDSYYGTSYQPYVGLLQ